MTRSRPLLLALLSGISGSGPSRWKTEASLPKAIDIEHTAMSACDLGRDVETNPNPYWPGLTTPRKKG
jgi:hypothetical protein